MIAALTSAGGALASLRSYLSPAMKNAAAAAT
jgi:hypothetical protein